MKDRKYSPGNYSFKENVYLCKNITSMSLQDHEIFMQHLAATDQYPKNEGSSPRSNGKLPYVYRERTRKYGNEELLKKLMEKYSQGTTAMSDRFTFMEENNHETNV